jgi:hypothetical protein
MCRNIKVLRDAETPATDEQMRLAALQFVRKVSGYREPSRANREAFDAAVTEVADATKKLLATIVVAPHSSPRRTHDHAGAVARQPRPVTGA